MRESAVRLSKAAREFNLGVHTVVEYLANKGHKVDSNPNTKLSGEQYDLLNAAFGTSKAEKARTGPTVVNHRELGSSEPGKLPVKENPKIQTHIDSATNGAVTQPATTQPEGNNSQAYPLEASSGSSPTVAERANSNVEEITVSRIRGKLNLESPRRDRMISVDRQVIDQPKSALPPRLTNSTGTTRSIPRQDTWSSDTDNRGNHNSNEKSYDRFGFRRIYLDVESQKSDKDVGGWNPELMLLALAVTFDDTHGYRTWYEQDTAALVSELLMYDEIVGYNIVEFDLRLVEAYDTRARQLAERAYDLLQVVYSAAGFRLKLDDVARATLGEGKAGDGMMSISLWKDGKVKEVEAYCMRDVEITKALYEHITRERFFYYPSNGERRKVSLDRVLGSPASASQVSEAPPSVELDPTNKEFNQALEFIKHTNRLVYLTGKAGTGKTTFLKHLKSTTSKRTVVLAPTGVAAINAGGQTIHSFFQIPLGLFAKDDKRLRELADPKDTDRSIIYDHFKYRSEKLDLIKGMELLIIDEVSMVRCDVLDVIDRLLRVFRRKRTLPFGGVQVLLVGDAFQLPPVVRPEERSVLEASGYAIPYFFGSRVLNENELIFIELKKIYRQKDEEFIALLNRIRVNEIDQSVMLALDNRFNPLFEPDADMGYITLGTHNAQVEDINERKLLALETPEHHFSADVVGEFPEKLFPTDRLLRLKVGAQVMFLRNDKTTGVYNGTIGRVTRIESNRISITLPDKREVIVQRALWKNVRYSWDKDAQRVVEDEIGTFTQYPLRLSWAITVHKSQGLTFEKVVADIGSAFDSGQVYVALSRCTSLNGLVLKSRIPRSAIRVDRNVLQFAKRETPETLIVEELNSGKADSEYESARSAFRAGRFIDAYNHVLDAIKYRNDMGSEMFNKYVRVHGARIRQLKLRENEWLSRFKEYEECRVKMSQKIHGIEEKYTIVSAENDILSNRIHQVNDELTYVKMQFDSMEKHAIELQYEVKSRGIFIEDLEKEIELNKKALSHYKQQMERDKREKVSSIEELLSLREQVKRLKEMSWWERLFGAR